MFNLRPGDKVWHKGVKRRIDNIRPFVGETVYQLSGCMFLIRREQFKPVLTVRDGVYIAGPRCV